MSRVSSEKLASVLADRLSPVIPPAISATAARGTIEIQASTGAKEVVDLGRTIQLAAESREQIVATIIAAVNQVQDFIAVELRVPWPGTARMPLASAGQDATSITVWFRDAGQVTLALEPIPWQDIEDRTSP